MLIDIHNVGHGACSVVTSSDGRKIMIDCGYGLEAPFFPSIRYSGQNMEMLFVQNLDSDHVDDLPDLMNHVGFKAFRSNHSISAETFLRMKEEGGMNDALWALWRILAVAGPNFGPNAAFPDFWWHSFWNNYGNPFTETNDLSMPLFVGKGGFTILFGGDLEADGWRNLLVSPDFRRRLARVTVLVASHHGRRNGQCPELFNFCRPHVVIFSDYEHKHDTQQTVSWYGDRVQGIPDMSYPLGAYPMRKVLTTRSDGHMRIHVQANGNYMIYTEHKSAPRVGTSLDRVGLGGLLESYGRRTA
ncbi:ComEC/Rec2 family competence protein [Dongia sp.]|uniref:ComEC/Rec2 family competence protein n=1 Tax=Dongia sp. TaxID=1977262 RepID=UPI0035AEF6F1